MKFTHKYDGTTVTVDLPEDISLSELLPMIEGFLRACTYEFDGHLEIVEEKE